MSSPSYTLINQTAHDPYTPSGPVCRTSTIGELSHTWSKLFLMSHQESLSNDSISTAGATNHKDSVVHSGQGALYDSPNTSWGQGFSVFVCKSCHALQKSTSCLRNQSLSTVCTSPGTAHNHHPITTSIPEQEANLSDRSTIESRVASSLPSTLRSPPDSALSLATDGTPSPVNGTSLSALLDGHSVDPCGDPRASRRSTISHFRSRPAGGVQDKHDILSVPGKHSNISWPRDPLHLTHVDFHPSTGECTNLPEEWQRLSQDNSMSKARRPKISTPFYPAHLTHVGFDRFTGEFISLPEKWKNSLQDSGILKSERPEISAPCDLIHITHVVLDPSTGEFTNLPEEWQHLLRNGSTLKSKHPEISTPSHITHVGLNRSTRKFTGLARAWQQLLEGSGISKSRQEKNSPTIMKAAKIHQGNGADVRDTMGCIVPARRPSQLLPFRAMAQSHRFRDTEFVIDNSTTPVSVVFCDLSPRC